MGRGASRARIEIVLPLTNRFPKSVYSATTPWSGRVLRCFTMDVDRHAGGVAHRCVSILGSIETHDTTWSTRAQRHARATAIVLVGLQHRAAGHSFVLPHHTATARAALLRPRRHGAFKAAADPQPRGTAASPLRAGPRRSTQRRTPFLFQPAKVKRLLACAASLPDYRPRGWHWGPTYRMIFALIFALMFGLGLRVGKVSRLCHEHARPSPSGPLFTLPNPDTGRGLTGSSTASSLTTGSVHCRPVQ